VVAIPRGIRPLVWLLVCAVVAIPWLVVVRQLKNAHPAAQSSIAPTSVFWGERVFTSRATLDFWLRNRGASYGDWARRHPDARAIFEPGRPAVAPSQTLAAPSAPSKAAARSVPKRASKGKVGHTSSVFKPPVLAPGLKSATRPAPSAESARKVVAPAPAGRKPALQPSPRARISLAQQIGEIALLLLSGLAIAIGFAPSAQLRRLAHVSAPLEFRIAAVAAGITIAVVVATVSFIS
jgi:hypothetical protein